MRNPRHRRAGNAKQRSTCLSVETAIHLNMWRTRASPAHIAAFSPGYGAKAFETVAHRMQTPKRIRSGSTCRRPSEFARDPRDASSP